MENLYKVENAIIMAAGLSSRFTPISYEKHKALIKVKGEVLIERQIKQLKEVGIDDITVVVGYKKEDFNYLIDKFNIKIVENPEYFSRNNHSSLYYVKEKLGNTYICSADNYFKENIFKPYLEKAFYSAVFSEGKTEEWCIESNKEGLITNVTIGGIDSWIMLGHVFFSKNFSKKFVKILEEIYKLPETYSLLWEQIYIDNIENLNMYIYKYSKDIIFEFDTLEELREFDESYINNTGSKILKKISKELFCQEKDITNIKPINQDGTIIGFKFKYKDKNKYYHYNYDTKQITKESAK